MYLLFSNEKKTYRNFSITNSLHREYNTIYLSLTSLAYTCVSRTIILCINIARGVYDLQHFLSNHRKKYCQIYSGEWVSECWFNAVSASKAIFTAWLNVLHKSVYSAAAFKISTSPHAWRIVPRGSVSEHSVSGLDCTIETISKTMIATYVNTISQLNGCIFHWVIVDTVSYRSLSLSWWWVISYKIDMGWDFK